MLLSSKVQSQNLVLNPSFEDTISCIIWQGGYPQLPCFNWFWANSGSSDYFSQIYNCNTSTSPDTTIGFQIARTGISYVGIGVYLAPYFSFPETREYIEGGFVDTLTHGHSYCVSFYVSAANKFKYVIDAIGAYISTDSVYNYTSDTVLSNYTPQINNPAGNVLNDTMNWTLISGIYNAQGGEKYITIGNFKNNSNLTLDSLNNNAPPQFGGAYYFIDDVSVVDCTVGLEEINYNNKISIIPNPAKDKIKINAQPPATKSNSIEITNVMGKIVLKKVLPVEKEDVEVSFLSAGVYFVKQTIGKQTLYAKFVKE